MEPPVRVVEEEPTAAHDKSTGDQPGEESCAPASRGGGLAPNRRGSQGRHTARLGKLGHGGTNQRWSGSLGARSDSKGVGGDSGDAGYVLSTYRDAQVRLDFGSRRLEEMAGSRLRAGDDTLVAVKGQGPTAWLQLHIVILLAASACSNEHPRRRIDAGTAGGALYCQ